MAAVLSHCFSGIVLDSRQSRCFRHAKSRIYRARPGQCAREMLPPPCYFSSSSVVKKEKPGFYCHEFFQIRCALSAYDIAKSFMDFESSAEEAYEYGVSPETSASTHAIVRSSENYVDY